MSKTFTPVSLDGRQQYYELWARTPQRSLDYTLANLWGWQDYYGLEWCFDDNLCWIRQTRPYQVCWAPVGDWNAVSWKDLLPCGFNPEAHNITRVPEKLLEIWQRELPGLVADGRDMGTVIFPDAALKVYLSASAQCRAERRFKQLIDKGLSANIADLLADLQARDARDMQRSAAPLKPAEDALHWDNHAERTIEQAVQQVLAWWEQRQPFAAAQRP